MAKLCKQVCRKMMPNKLENQWRMPERSQQPCIIANRGQFRLCKSCHNRKNFLFCNTPRGARASATIFSIIESAKENRLNPYAYPNYLFEKLPNLESRDDAVLDQLLPWNATLH